MIRSRLSARADLPRRRNGSGFAERSDERVQLLDQIVVLGTQARDVALGHPVGEEREPFLCQFESRDEIALPMKEMFELAAFVALPVGHNAPRLLPGS